MSYQQVEEAISHFLDLVPTPSSSVCVALSGGMDSVVLLHALTHSQTHFSVSACHVNHGLQSASGEWVGFCRDLCKQWQVPLRVESLSLGQPKREGIENLARQARYKALFEGMHAEAVLVTAHHRRDQVETGLMNFIRGGGVTGLAAMPALKSHAGQWHAGQWHARPLLKVPYESLKAYAAHYRLNWVEDESNQDVHLRRNWIRHQVLPSILQTWPEAEQSLAASIDYAQEAKGLMDELAALDLAECSHNYFMLDFNPVLGLSQARQKNLLRYWAARYDIRLNHKIYTWVSACLSNLNPMAKPKMQGAEGRLALFEFGCLYVFNHAPGAFEVEYAQFEPEAYFFHQTSLLTHQVAPRFFTENQQVRVRSLNSDDLMRATDVKALKKWFKDNRVPSWNRTRWPLLEINGEVAAVLGFRTFDAFQ